MTFDAHTELQILEALEKDPEISQADLASRVGVAVGTVNWYLKRWSSKGYVKIKRIGRWRWRYLLTPSGMKRRARLASRYIEASMTLYRVTRLEALRLLGQIKRAGFDQVTIEGEGDIAEICALTCLELGLTVDKVTVDPIPSIRVNQANLELIWPGSDDNQ